MARLATGRTFAYGDAGYFVGLSVGLELAALPGAGGTSGADHKPRCAEGRCAMKTILSDSGGPCLSPIIRPRIRWIPLAVPFGTVPSVTLDAENPWPGGGCHSMNGRADRLQKSGRIVYTYPTLLGPSDM